MSQRKDEPLPKCTQAVPTDLTSFFIIGKIEGEKIVAPSPDIEDIIDAGALLKALPERMVKAGIIRDEGGKLNNADKLYLCRQRHRISKYNWSDAEKIERMRQLYVDEGLPCAEVAKIVGKGQTTVQRQLNKLGVIRR